LKVWIVTDIPAVDESMVILKVFSTAELADVYREGKMVREPELRPRDRVSVEEWDVEES
jgi:hypothetical protein